MASRLAVVRVERGGETQDGDGGFRRLVLDPPVLGFLEALLERACGAGSPSHGEA